MPRPDLNLLVTLDILLEEGSVARAARRLRLSVAFAKLVRAFTLRTSEGFVETFGPRLIERVRHEAPRVQLRFMQKPHKDSAPLRDGEVDLASGVLDTTTVPELRDATLRGTVTPPSRRSRTTRTRLSTGSRCCRSAGGPCPDC